jgi:cysteine-rich repeat protein
MSGLRSVGASRRQRLLLILLLAPDAGLSVLEPSLVAGGDFQGGDALVVSTGNSWAYAEISGCPCPATRGLHIAASSAGSAAILPVSLTRPPGVVTFEAMGIHSADYLGHPDVFRLRALDHLGGELAGATARRAPTLTAWNRYVLRLSITTAFASLELRVGSGMPGGAAWETTANTGVVIDDAVGSFNATDFWFGFENAQMLPIISRGKDVEGPVGMGSRTPNLLTDGSIRLPPYGSVPWEIMAFGMTSPVQMTIDLGKLYTICGTRLVQSDEKWAKSWSIHGAVADPSAGGDWITLLEAGEPATYSSKACTVGAADSCVRVVASAETNEHLFPCSEIRFIRLDLEARTDCCFLVIEWQLLGLHSDAICTPQCLNGGRCSSATTSCECPVLYGWDGPDCSTPLCAPPCENGGHCYSALQCHCVPGYAGQACTRERCGDGYVSSSEICDDGNAADDDGCVLCELEDPRLVRVECCRPPADA